MNRGNLLVGASMFATIFAPMIFSLIAAAEQGKAAQDKMRARRLSDARMNARLLRLNI